VEVSEVRHSDLEATECLLFYNIWWQDIPVPHSPWEERHLLCVNSTGEHLVGSTLGPPSYSSWW